MGWLFVGVGILGFVLLLVNWFVSAKPSNVLRSLAWLLLALGFLLALFLIASGRFHMLWVAALTLLPWIGRFRTFRRFWKTMRGPSPGRQSRVRTEYLDMMLDHDTGALDGTVTKGMNAGQRLSDLGQQECELLLEFYIQQDRQSAELLRNFIDRSFGGAGSGRDEETAGDHNQRRRSNGNGGRAHEPDRQGMSREEALEVLGLKDGAEESDIREAHRRLMKQVHPDRGGSDYLAAKINQAKDLLLG